MGNKIPPVHEIGVRTMEPVWKKKKKKKSPVSSLLVQPRWIIDAELLEIIASGHPAAPKLQLLLDRFSHLFAEPMLLPPRHSRDHQISLLLDSTPTNVRPYRYAQIEKDEIERAVKALLETRLI
jgi:hypothetical protein